MHGYYFGDELDGSTRSYTWHSCTGCCNKFTQSWSHNSLFTFLRVHKFLCLRIGRSQTRRNPSGMRVRRCFSRWLAWNATRSGYRIRYWTSARYRSYIKKAIPNATQRISWTENPVARTFRQGLYPPKFFTMGLPSSVRKKERWQLEVVCWLPASQCGYYQK